MLCYCWNLRSINNKIQTQSVMNFLSDQSIFLLLVIEMWTTGMNNDVTQSLETWELARYLTFDHNFAVKLVFWAEKSKFLTKFRRSQRCIGQYKGVMSHMTLKAPKLTRFAAANPCGSAAAIYFPSRVNMINGHSWWCLLRQFWTCNCKLLLQRSLRCMLIWRGCSMTVA